MGKQNKTIRNRRKIKVENYDNLNNDTSGLKNKITKAFAREAEFTIISIFIVTIIMISGAYAVFSTVQKQETYNTLTVGTLKIDFDATSTDLGNVINLNGTYPMSDIDGQKETNPSYSFKITNTGNLDAFYKVKIIDDDEMIKEDDCADNLLQKDKIKISINNSTPFLLNTVESNDYIIDSDILKANKSKVFSIKVWIDEDAGNEVLRRHYHGKIVVEGENAQSNKNIVVAYKYDEENAATKCISGTETTCQETDCYKDRNKDICPKGTIIKYKVNDQETIPFHVVYDNGLTLTMQSQKNIVYNTQWYYTKEDSIKAPNTILDKLESVTQNWDNVNSKTYELGTTSLSNKGEFTGCTQELVCNSNTYTLTERTAKARILTFQEAVDLGCTREAQSCPIWMYNYLFNSTNFSGTENDIYKENEAQTNAGYWLINSNSSNLDSAWDIYTNGNLTDNSIDNIEYGARAVIEINK